MKSNTDIALLLVRIGVAAVFIAHGWSKLSGMEGAISFFASLGLASFWAYLVAYVEFIGGLAVLLGVFTGWAGLLLAINMLVAIIIVKASRGFLGGYEFELLLLLSSVAIALSGPGEHTIKKLWNKA